MQKMLEDFEPGTKNGAEEPLDKVGLGRGKYIFGLISQLRRIGRSIRI